MGTINSTIEYFKNITTEQVISILVAIAVVIVFFIFSRFISYFILKLFIPKNNRRKIKRTGLYKDLKIVIELSGIYIASRILYLTPEQDAFITKIYKLMLYWGFANIISGAYDIKDDFIEKVTNNKVSYSTRDKFTSEASKKVVRWVCYICAFFLSCKLYDINIEGLATGLGVASAIVALAAQNFVKQVMAGIDIYADKPFDIGDWIETCGIEGTVVFISLRSTKIKTVEDTIVTIDNVTLTSSNITNWGKIKKRHFETNLRLFLDTPEITVERLINRINFILKYDSEIIEDSISVQLIKIDNDALCIEIYLDTTVTDYYKFKAFKNKVNLTLLNILETQGISLSYPAQNIYIKSNETMKISSHNDHKIGTENKTVNRQGIKPDIKEKTSLKNSVKLEENKNKNNTSLEKTKIINVPEIKKVNAKKAQEKKEK